MLFRHFFFFFFAIAGSSSWLVTKKFLSIPAYFVCNRLLLEISDELACGKYLFLIMHGLVTAFSYKVRFNERVLSFAKKEKKKCCWFALFFFSWTRPFKHTPPRQQRARNTHHDKIGVAGASSRRPRTG